MTSKYLTSLVNDARNITMRHNPSRTNDDVTIGEIFEMVVKMEPKITMKIDSLEKYDFGYCQPFTIELGDEATFGWKYVIEGGVGEVGVIILTDDEFPLFMSWMYEERMNRATEFVAKMRDEWYHVPGNADVLGLVRWMRDEKGINIRYRGSNSYDLDINDEACCCYQCTLVLDKQMVVVWKLGIWNKVSYNWIVLVGDEMNQLRSQMWNVPYVAPGYNEEESAWLQ